MHDFESRRRETPPDDSTRLFSERAEDYVRYRPGYPSGVLRTLKSECGLNGDSVVADVGSGTGKLSRLFLKNGNAVYGVEPNREMREVGEEYLAGFSNFTSVVGTAEATTLPDDSADFVTAGQAFHWFDLSRARDEFSRVLKTGGWTALVWNNPDISSPFASDYLNVAEEFGRERKAPGDARVEDATLRSFFASGCFERRTHRNHQSFDFESLKGRLLSSSRMPKRGEPRFEEMIQALRNVFERHEKQGVVILEYETKHYYGRL